MTPSELHAHLQAQLERRRAWKALNKLRLAGDPIRRAALQVKQQPLIDYFREGRNGYIEEHRFDELDED